jgi:hypothetical protein
MKKKYFNNKGHQTAIYIPREIYYSIGGFYEMPPSCSASAGKLEVSIHEDSPYAGYDSKPFPGAKKSEGETIVIVGREILKFNGWAAPEGYKMHNIFDDWESEGLPKNNRLSIPFSAMSRTSIDSIVREAKKANQ